MSYQAPLPNTGAILPVPGSGQDWEVAVYNGNFTGVEAAVTADRARLSSIEGKIANNAVVPAGTTSARDGFYGTPSSAAARVALANSVPRWFNTDKGYTQQYFAQDGDAGAGIFTRATAGWYAAVDSGRVPLSGFTVTSTGGTVTRDGGAVQLAGAVTAVQLKSLFTTDFMFYDFELEMVAVTAVNDLFWRASSAGVDNSSANYNRQRVLASGTSTLVGAGSTGQTAGLVGHMDLTQAGAIDFTVQNPADPTRRTSSRSAGFDGGNLLDSAGSLLNVLAAHDGITFFVSTNTFNGRLRVFGRNPF